VIGKLTVIARVKRKTRWSYVCRCECGNVTPALRAAYLRKRSARACCVQCARDLPRSEMPVRPEPPMTERYMPAGHPIWRSRAQRLAAAIQTPMTMAAILVLAKARFDWHPDLTREVLASAYGNELARVQGLWQASTALRFAAARTAAAK
jgi:hypothetical protein